MDQDGQWKWEELVRFCMRINTTVDKQDGYLAPGFRPEEKENRAVVSWEEGQGKRRYRLGEGSSSDLFH